MNRYSRRDKKHIYKHVKTHKDEKYIKGLISVFIGAFLIITANPIAMLVGVNLILLSCTYMMFCNSKPYVALKQNIKNKISKKRSYEDFWNKYAKEQKKENNLKLTKFKKEEKQEKLNAHKNNVLKADDLIEKYNSSEKFKKEVDNYLIKHQKTSIWKKKVEEREQKIIQESEQLLEKE